MIVVMIVDVMILFFIVGLTLGDFLTGLISPGFIDLRFGNED